MRNGCCNAVSVGTEKDALTDIGFDSAMHSWHGEACVFENKHLPDFSQMRRKGSRFTLGGWGLRVYSLDVAQPFVTVRNCSQPSATARSPPWSSCVAGAALQTCRIACFFANRIVRAASSGDNVQILWQG